ncbi:hypothetical protein JBKA6_0684 [Ichthyobacterium seriolicida]|uniref:Peptidase S74 domain-containing protein n=1 Tax=Ichthyobacterium seriolicida TaxID=242600 RepID=A0A1J1DXX1_9FLAO|nr:hypothetical protein JBKA6_0684 [Ichthyobacterium seriolicida]
MLSDLEAISQTFPDKLNYQLTVRKGQKLIKEHSVSVRISIYSSKEKVLYSETYSSIKTNKDGLLNLSVGDGLRGEAFSTLKLSSLQWGDTTYYIKSEIDLNANNNYDNAIVNKSEILSVPYALYAKNSPKVEVIDNLDSNSTTKALSANQGSVLKAEIDKKLDKRDIIDDLNTENDKKALSASQGKKIVDVYGVMKKWRNNQIHSVSDIVLRKGKFFSLISPLDKSEKNTPPEHLKSKWLNLSIFDKISSNVIMNWSNSSATARDINNIKGDNNLVLGLNSANSLSTGSDNIILGKGSGNAITTAYKNISVGNKALNSNSIGNNNIAVGNNSLKLTNANKNIAIGISALSKNITGVENISIGYNAGSYHGNFDSKNANTGSKKSIYIGQEVTSSSATADNEIVIGYRAEGKGHNTVVIGHKDSKTYIPNGALELTNGDLDIKSGNINLSSGNANISGQLSTSNFHTQWDASKTYSQNDIIIYQGDLYKKNTSSPKSTISPSIDNINWELISGSSVSEENLKKISENIITAWSGKDGKGKSGGSGTKNMFFGIGSGNSIGSGSDNIAVGTNSLSLNTIGSRNISLGNNSLAKLNSTNENDISKNVAIGNNAGCYKGDYSTSPPSDNNSKSKNSIYLGADTRSANEASTENEIVIGYGAIGKGSNTIVLGNSETTDTYITNGDLELTEGNIELTKGNFYITKGNLRLSNGNVTIKGELMTNSFNTSWDDKKNYLRNHIVIKDGILYKSLENNINADPLISYIKWQAINAGLIKINDNLITRWSGLNSNETSAGTGSKNMFLGIGSGNSNTSGSNNLAIGYNSLNTNTTGEKNIAIGMESLMQNTGSGNIAIGAKSLIKNQDDDNIAIGYESLNENTSGSGNIAIGYRSLHLNTKKYNIAIGHEALKDLNNGYYNIAIGSFSGSGITKCEKSIYLGANTSSKDVTAPIDNEIVIGYEAKGKGTNTLVLGNDDILETHLSGKVFLSNNCGSPFFSEDYGLLNVNGCYDIKGEKSGYFFDGGGGNSLAGLVTALIGDRTSISASNSIVTLSYFHAVSDRRIKDIIGISDKNEDLKKLLNIEILDYTMIDSIEKGNKSFKKVIAQQIENIVPEVVSIGKGVIPNVYEVAKSVSKSSSLGSIITTYKKHGFSNGDKVKLIIEDGGDKGVIVKEVIDSNTFLIEDILDLNLRVFVYGKEINDLRSVDYNGLTTLNISATQAIYQEMKDENSSFRKMINKIKNKNVALKEDIEVLNKESASLKESITTLQNDFKDKNDKLRLMFERIKILENK